VGLGQRNRKKESAAQGIQCYPIDTGYSKGKTVERSCFIPAKYATNSDCVSAAIAGNSEPAQSVSCLAGRMDY